MEALSSENFSSLSSYEEDGPCNKRKRKKLENSPCCCPVCGLTVRSGEWATHYTQELERVCKFKLRASEQCPKNASDGDKRWSTYVRVKGNRQMRLRTRNRKEVICPVCNKNIHGTAEELNQHVDGCLIQQDPTTEDEEVDVEGNAETYEEYEWAGQHRIRATTLIPGGFAALGVATKICTDNDEEEKVVVDVDESIKYGAPQYSEADLVATSADDSVGPSDRVVSSSTKENGTGDSALSLEGTQNPVIEVLKTRIKSLERGSEKRTVCLICMDNYKVPVVSISCWHVYCEQCWLHALGAKKLCPQCNMITSPSDLRRIYL